MLELEDRLRSLVDTRAPTITLDEVYARRATTTTASHGTRWPRTRRSATAALVAVCAIAIAVTAAVITTSDRGTGPKVVARGATAAPAKSLSEQQWAKQVNSVCQQFNKGLDEILAQNGGYPAQPDDVKRAATVNQIVPVLEHALTSIHALDEPKATRKDANKLAAGLSDGIATLHSDPSVFNVVIVFEGSLGDAITSRRARNLGLKACTSSAVRRFAGLDR